MHHTRKHAYSKRDEDFAQGWGRHGIRKVECASTLTQHDHDSYSSGSDGGGAGSGRDGGACGACGAGGAGAGAGRSGQCVEVVGVELVVEVVLVKHHLKEATVTNRTTVWRGNCPVDCCSRCVRVLISVLTADLFLIF